MSKTRTTSTNTTATITPAPLKHIGTIVEMDSKVFPLLLLKFAYLTANKQI